MNIFILDENPTIAAQYLCNRHVVKMVLESAQMLCNCHDNAPYLRAHYNHPCSIWARESIQNYEWLKTHGLAIGDEYTFRYGKIHKSAEVIRSLPTPNLPNTQLTPFAQAMPIIFKDINAVTAYRRYYLEAKKHLLDYSKREPPFWINNVAIPA